MNSLSKITSSRNILAKCLNIQNRAFCSLNTEVTKKSNFEDLLQV